VVISAKMGYCCRWDIFIIFSPEPKLNENTKDEAKKTNAEKNSVCLTLADRIAKADC